MIFFINKKYLKSATTSHFTDFSYSCLHCVKLTKATCLLSYLLILNVHYIKHVLENHLHSNQSFLCFVLFFPKSPFLSFFFLVGVVWCHKTQVLRVASFSQISSKRWLHIISMYDTIVFQNSVLTGLLVLSIYWIPHWHERRSATPPVVFILFLISPVGSVCGATYKELTLFFWSACRQISSLKWDCFS